jgi:hypothetical protein
MDNPNVLVELIDGLRTAMHREFDEVKNRLDHINGTVRRHNADIAVLQTVAHPSPCPAGCEVMKEIREIKVEQEVRKKVGVRVIATASAAGAVIAFIADIILRLFVG